MKTIEDIQKEVVENFASFEDWTDKYAYIIEFGNELPELEAKHRIEQNLIRGCQSRLWLHAENRNNKIYFNADSDSLIMKGVVALLLLVYSGKSAQEILHANTDFIREIGLDTHLSPVRSNGLNAMLKQIRFYAAALAIKK